MKVKRQNVRAQILIVSLAAIVLGLMLQMANAQTISTSMPQRSFWSTFPQKTTLNYYHQVLGPTVGGPSGETYNVFQEARAPYQSFHAANLRYQINPNWAVGTSLAAVNAYGDTITNQNTGVKSDSKVRDEFFNARAFVSVPSIKLPGGTLYSTFSYEHPTSNVSKANEMKYGYVISENFQFAIPSVKWSAGVNGQYYRVELKEKVKKIPAGYYFPGSTPENIIYQTVIVSGGPWLNYRFSDKWMWGSSVTMDWDQRGYETGSKRFGNNLPDRARTGITYFPAVKYFASVGLFTQALLKYSTDTHAVGGEFALKF